MGSGSKGEELSAIGATRTFVSLLNEAIKEVEIEEGDLIVKLYQPDFCLDPNAMKLRIIVNPNMPKDERDRFKRALEKKEEERGFFFF